MDYGEINKPPRDIGHTELTAKIEPFDSFWEAPDNIEKGYKSFFSFYRRNYLKYVPRNRDIRILVISCGPGYFVNLLVKHGYRNVTGIDSDESKVSYAKKRGLPCVSKSLIEFLGENKEFFDVIFCEQEINHLTKSEILWFLSVCMERLVEDGRLIVHVLNGANPITGAESLAQNFDHFNTFTEYTLRQVLEYRGFKDIIIFPLDLYVFYFNPLNYVLIIISYLYTVLFRISFIIYGKKNRIFTKKIGALAVKRSGCMRNTAVN